MSADAVVPRERESSPRIVTEHEPDPACAHCGLPIVTAVTGADPRLRFCCAGCQMAYSVIHEAGLGAYYLHRAQADAAPAPVRSSGRDFAEYDDPAFWARYVKRDGELASIELFVEGIHCAACVWLLERLPRTTPGVLSARVDLGRGALHVSFDPARVELGRIARALDGLGYTPHPAEEGREAAERERDRSLLVRLGVAGAIAGNVMLMALALYSGALSGMDPSYATFFRWSSFVLAVPSVAWCGSVFFRGALAALRTRSPHMDLPVSIGILAGFSGSAWNTLAGAGEIYFDSITVLIFLLLVGRWLQHKHHRRATRAAELIGALAPATARRVQGDTVRQVPAESLERDAVVEVLAGERIPADGVVLEGSSSVDASWLSGETLPEDVAPGSRVYAGTRNLLAGLRVRVEAVACETRLGRLLASVEEAQRSRAPIVRLADRVAGHFVLVVLALGALTTGVWLFVDPSRALDNTVALLVVTCPCALGMATPLSVSAALRRAARAGVLFKGGEFLEALARPATLVFDKTGTLTEGRLALVSLSGDPSLRPLIRAAEARSPHPIARALVAALCGEPELLAESVEERAGAGVRARVAGRTVLVGSPDFLRENGVSIGPSSAAELEAHAAQGRPAVAVAVDGEIGAVAAFADEVRADAASSLAALRELGYRIAILSGDRQRVVDGVAAGLGELIDARGDVSPEQKLRWVEAARRRGPVVMIGDGVNDAAAMVAADVGIAVHGGAEASLRAADVFTTEPGVEKVLQAVLGARRTLGVIRRGIAFSLAYNVIGVALAIGGVLSPLIAAVLMPLSSLTVVSSALYAKTFGPKESS